MRYCTPTSLTNSLTWMRFSFNPSMSTSPSETTISTSLLLHTPDRINRQASSRCTSVEWPSKTHKECPKCCALLQG